MYYVLENTGLFSERPVDDDEIESMRMGITFNRSAECQKMGEIGQSIAIGYLLICLGFYLSSLVGNYRRGMYLPLWMIIVSFLFLLLVAPFLVGIFAYRLIHTKKNILL
jgi:hypothetical protein